MTDFRSRFVVLALVYLSTGVLFAIVTPIGEGPDEPAHLRYVRHLAQENSLPEEPKAYGPENYEWHQPPLDYAISSILLGAISPGGIDLTFTPNAAFDFRRAGSRAFEASGESAGEVRALRIIRLGWGLIALFACVSLASRFLPDTGGWLTAAYFFAPQLLFLFAVINNDAAVIALGSLLLLLLVRFIDAPSARLGMATGLCLLAALFAKASAGFLIAPVIAAALMTGRQKTEHRLQPVLWALLGSSGVAMSAFLIFNQFRFASVIPSVPTAGRVASPAELLYEPRWIGSLFVSFWAKLGWLNTRMPWPFYAWFALLSVSVVAGVVILLRRAETRRGAIVLLVALIANGLLMVAFLLRVDLQPQGRYLFPSIAAVATFGAAGLDAMFRRMHPRLALIVPAVAIAVALCAAYVLASAYRQSDQAPMPVALNAMGMITKS